MSHEPIINLDFFGKMFFKFMQSITDMFKLTF